MSELYWIILLGKVCVLSGLVMFVTGFITVIAWIVSVVKFVKTGGIESEYNSDWFCYKTARSIALKSFTACLIAAAIVVFTPSRNQMYMIVGVGTAIDYVQESESVKQLPDKCVDALNRWVDSLNKEDKE